MSENTSVHVDGTLAAKMFEIEIEGVLFTTKKRIEAGITDTSFEEEEAVERFSSWLEVVRANPHHYLFKKLESLWNEYGAGDEEGESLFENDTEDLGFPPYGQLRYLALWEMYGGNGQETFENYLQEYVDRFKRDLNKLREHVGQEKRQ